MRRSLKCSLVGVAALACLTIVQELRAGLPGNFLLGVLPNALAAMIIPFVFISIYPQERPGEAEGRIWRWFLGAALGACVGLIGWEFLQQLARRLFFDWNDIIATIMGFAIAVLTGARVMPRQRR